MKLRIFAVVCLLGILSPLAQAAGATKVAVLDLQAVVLMSEAGQSGMKELEKNADYTSLLGQLEDMEAELKGMDEELKGKGLTWGEDQKKKHQEKMNKLAQERQGGLMTLNRARESVFMQMLSAMEPAIAEALEEIMKTEGIELIVDSKSVVHKTPTADITAMVVEKLNKMNAAAKAKQKDSKSKK